MDSFGFLSGMDYILYIRPIAGGMQSINKHREEEQVKDPSLEVQSYRG